MNVNGLKRVFTAFIALILILCAGCPSAYAEEKRWICTGCGAENTSNFCTQCGMEKPETIECSVCGEQYPIDTDAVFCGSCGAKLQEDVKQSNRLEGSGFDTPEEAVTCYLEGLKNLDFEQILSAFAWETQAEHFSTDAKIKRLRSYSTSTEPRMLGDSDFIRTANLYSLISAQIDSLYVAIEIFILQDDHPSNAKNYVISFKDDKEFEEFKSKFSNGRLEKLMSLTNIRFLTPDELTDGMFSDDSNQKNFERLTAMYGADEVIELPAVADISNEILFCCPVVARYGEKWYLVSVNSITNALLGIDYMKQAFWSEKGDISDIFNDF